MLALFCSGSILFSSNRIIFSSFFLPTLIITCQDYPFPFSYYLRPLCGRYVQCSQQKDGSSTALSLVRCKSLYTACDRLCCKVDIASVFCSKVVFIPEREASAPEPLREPARYLTSSSREKCLPPAAVEKTMGFVQIFVFNTFAGPVRVFKVLKFTETEYNLVVVDTHYHAQTAGPIGAAYFKEVCTMFQKKK